jgi:FkbM family methyltransferase
MTYFSQLSQDQILDDKLFKRMENGVFVEVGAVDGYHFSNTVFFEKHRKWTGLCIEPNPTEFKKLKSSKRTCVKENYAIDTKESKVDFLAIDGYGKGLSGIVDKYDEKHLKRINEETKGHKSKKNFYKVKTIPLQKLFDIHGLDYIDYCSIDVEGAEFQVLNSIDFKKTYIKCFTIENNYGASREHSLLKKNGYKLWKKVRWEEFWVRDISYLEVLKSRIITPFFNFL